MSEPGGDDKAPLVQFGAERAKAFIDAVVAIAMTLLILPLMESVSEIAAQDGDAAHWIDVHQWQLITFVLSFVVIALFWLGHHQLFSKIERVTTPMLWISMAWLLTIVWLPVATAMTGQMSVADPLAKTLYIGAMSMASLLSFLQCVYVRQHPQVHEVPPDQLVREMSVSLAMAVLFALALVISLLVVPLSYFSLLVMFFTGVLARVFIRLFTRAGR